MPEFGGVCHFNFSYGPAALRDSSLGHGILEVWWDCGSLKCYELLL